MLGNRHTKTVFVFMRCSFWCQSNGSKHLIHIIEENQSNFAPVFLWFWSSEKLRNHIYLMFTLVSHWCVRTVLMIHFAPLKNNFVSVWLKNCFCIRWYIAHSNWVIQASENDDTTSTHNVNTSHAEAKPDMLKFRLYEKKEQRNRLRQ